MSIVKVSCFPNQGTPEVIQGTPQDGDIVRITGSNGSVVYERFTSAVASQPAPLRWDALDFTRRFTQAERIAIRTLAKSNGQAEDFLDLLGKAAATGTYIHSDDPDVLAGLTAFESAGVIGAGRADEILGG